MGFSFLRLGPVLGKEGFKEFEGGNDRLGLLLVPARVRVVGNHSGPVGPFNVGLGPLSARCHAQDFTSQLRICSRLGGYYGYLLYPTSATIELWLVMCLSN